MRTFTKILALGGAIAFAACSDGTGPAIGAAFSRDITIGEFDTVLTATGAARVEIKLVPGGLVAREVEIEEGDETGDEEEIESRVTAISGGAGTLTLDLGGLTVSFDANTKFQTEDDESVTQAEFVALIEAALAAGDEPAIEAERAAPAQPQAPDDATFLASKIELDDEAEEPEIEINIAPANLTLNATPPPDAILRVLDLPIELRVSEGITELESEIEDERDEVDFEGVVQAVDEAAGTVTLTDGTVIRIVDATDIGGHGDDGEDGDDDGDDDGHDGHGDGGDLLAAFHDDDELGSLAEVAAALAAGDIVEAEGKGFVESESPLVIVAVEVEFEVEDDADDVPDHVEFEDRVTAVDVTAGTLTLATGTVVRITGTTVFDGEGDLLTLQATADAVAAGETVRAEGDATVESVTPRVLIALEIKVEVDD
jgi:hypothetical protein